MAAAAAATVGARRGRARGQVLLVEAELQRKAAENQMKRQQNELAQSILEKYDADHNGALSREELQKMLKDYSKHRYNSDVQPTEEDLSFLFRLFDKKGGKGKGGKPDGSIDRGELMSLLRAWGDFMKQKEVVQKLVHTFDKDENNAIDVDELQEILEATHKGSVKPEVTQWVMGQSDLNGNGTLNDLELARALLSFELLCKGEPHIRKDLSEGVVVDPTLEVPKKSSRMCSIQ
eukprot:symbB.v1.2.005352.t1/scaffold301.1/size235092/4